MESDGKGLESRIAHALQKVKHLFPENRSPLDSPYDDVTHINQDGVGKYRIVSFKYHPERFVEEPNIADFEKAFRQYLAEIRKEEIESLVDYLIGPPKTGDSSQTLSKEEQEKKEKEKAGKRMKKREYVIRTIIQSKGADSLDTARMRVLPYRVLEKDVEIIVEDKSGKKEIKKETIPVLRTDSTDEMNPVITASLDTLKKRIYFGYKKDDVNAKQIMKGFMSWFMDGRNKHETTEFVRNLRDYVERSPDSTITYLG